MSGKSREQNGARSEKRAFTIRPARRSDAKAITDIYNEAVATTTATFDLKPQSVEARLSWLEAHDEQHPVLVAETNGGVVGWAALSKWSDRAAYDRTVESSFYVAEDARGQGIGRALKERTLDEARRLDYYTVLALISEGNAASIHLNEALGFEHIGTMKELGFKFGEWLDVHIMQLMLESPRKPVYADGQSNNGVMLVESLAPEQIRQLHGLLKQQWWGGGRSLEEVQLMVKNTPLLIGAIDRSSSRLVGFCRALTDFSFRATIYDVMVDEDWKGQGLGTRLMDTLSQHPKLANVSMIYLACEPKLFSFYERWGFKVYDERAKWMVKVQRKE